MVHLTKIYTKTGDQGFTDLANRTRTFKTDPVIEAVGAVDEANSAIGMATEYYNDIIQRIQSDLCQCYNEFDHLQVFEDGQQLCL